MNKESLIAENGSFDGSSWNWALVWRRPLLLQREIDLAHELQAMIELVQPKVHMEDLWLWKCDSSKAFTVRSAYDFVYSFYNIGEVVDEVVMLALRRIWKTKAPRKSMVFAWQLLLRSLPVRQALVRRGVLLIHEDCVFCNNREEDVTHLFLHCDVASSVWYSLCRWLGFSSCLSDSVEGQLLTMSGFVAGKKPARVVVTIWVATVWSLWLHRNKIVFNNGVCDVLEVVESVKYRSWKWLTAGMNHGNIPFVNWLNEPYHYFSSFL
ncbi:uncharacterized protein LOC109788691 [Cajanus cajan]|uniref:uncharacterized protein LOC109788691 n=1 Tax=Cajanus cajan TaxID=3821 RepID=UPI00098D9A6B|nr:uncharacterized protein LOC109788691 [Cajanus cajan]